jgi:hypothetical protein
VAGYVVKPVEAQGIAGISAVKKQIVIELSGAGIATPKTMNKSLSAVVVRIAKESDPLLHYLCAPRFNNPQDITQYRLWDLRMVIAQKTFPCLCNPNLSAVGCRFALRDVDVYRLQRLIFIGPEIYPVGTDLKDLRHGRILPAAKIR